MVVVAPRIPADFADIRLWGVIYRLVIIEQHRDHRLRAVDEAAGVHAFLEVVLHPLHRGVAAFEEPPFEPLRFRIEPLRFRDPARVEAEAASLRFESEYEPFAGGVVEAGHEGIAFVGERRT